MAENAPRVTVKVGTPWWFWVLLFVGGWALYGLLKMRPTDRRVVYVEPGREMLVTPGHPARRRRAA